jgi:hypothetical protein
MDTRFKPMLKQWGKRKIVYCKLSHVLMFLCLITPGTNWAIPLIYKKVKGNIRIEI